MDNKDENMPLKDIVFSVALIIFSIYIIVTSLGLKYQNTFIDGAGFFPLIIGVVLLVLGLVLLFVGIRTGGVQRFKEVANGNTIVNFLKNDRTVRVVVLVAMMIIYMYILLGRIPFIAATSIYLFANYMYLQSCQKFMFIPGPVMAVIISIAVSVITYYGMRYGLGITLP